MPSKLEMGRHISLLIFTWILMATTAMGQDTVPPMYVDHLTIRDGLSHNTVHCLLQDRHGYIWVGTQHGLNKYDGYSFEVLLSGQSQDGQSGFMGNKITALLEDRAGNLWVGTGKYGINIRPASQDHFRNHGGDSTFHAIQGAEITSFYEDRAGQMWITSLGAGLLRYDPSTQHVQHYSQANSGLSSDLVFDLVEDAHGTIWVAAAGGGLNILGKDDRFTLSHPMLPNDPNLSGYHKKFWLDGDQLWVATEGTGLYQMNLQDRRYTRFAVGEGQRSLSSDGVRDIYHAADGRWFIATDGGGLNVYDPQTGRVSCYPHQADSETGLNSNALFCLLGDRTGNIWMGTYNGGINIYKPSKVWFQHFAPSLLGSEQLQNRSILSLFQSHDGRLWVGSDGGGLNWLDTDKSSFSNPPFQHDPAAANTLSGNAVKALFEDRSHRLWIGLFGRGLDRYDPSTATFEHILGYPTNVWSITERQNGQIWLGSMGEGVIVLDPETLERRYLTRDSHDSATSADPNVMVVMTDQQDQVWVGTAFQGLDRWDDESQAFVHYRHDPDDPQSLSNDEVRAIYQDSRGDLWIGTEGGGLNKWLGQGRFKRLGVEQGLIANSVMGITEDSAGMLWLSTYEGISRLNPETMSIRNFDFRNPQYANQFNQASILTTGSGKLFFGGINGLNAIHPQQVGSQQDQPDVILTGLQIFNRKIGAGEQVNDYVVLDQPIEEADRIHLSYLDKSFSFEFSAIDYTSPLDYQYRYQMEGFDDQWHETSIGQHRVSYTNLDPGTYTFKVAYQDQQATVEVYIAPPIWQTTWFRVLLLLLGIGLLAGGGYVMIKRREAKHQRELLQLQHDKLASEVEAKTSKLMYSAVQIAHKNEILAGLKQELLHTQKESGAGLGSLVQKLDLELKNEDHWKEFDIYFNQVDQDFFQALLAEHPDLTKNDLRMCSLIRINLSTKEIAFLLNISNRAVEQGRYRLKKRLGLGKEEDLNRYITTFQPAVR